MNSCTMGFIYIPVRFSKASPVKTRRIEGFHRRFRLVLNLCRLTDRVEPDETGHACQQGGAKKAGLGHLQQATGSLAVNELIERREDFVETLFPGGVIDTCFHFGISI